MPSRRTFLAAVGATAVSLAGCTARPDDPPESGVDSRPDPDRHIYGADGEWSSFGCNASNTRAVADGRAPVEGVAERWRVAVPQTTYAEPVVADGRVFQPLPSGIAAYDATDGSELWTVPDADTTPLVRDGTVYVGASDVLLALDAASGEQAWERPLDGKGPVRTPGTYAGDWLYVPTGETIYRIDAETGEVDWSRRLFGRLLGSPPVYSGHWIALASEAGELSLLGPDGTGWGEWDLPSTPTAPPTADTDGVYVGCRDGRTYGVDLEHEPRFEVAWSVDTGFANAGLAVEEYLYAVGTDLHAVDPETGERLWTRETGDWRWTAPALARDTVFVGGDALYAFDPTPSGPLADGPALRFEASFHGRVGPGPVLDDGVVYVVARTDESSFHLLALESDS